MASASVNAIGTATADAALIDSKLSPPQLGERLLARFRLSSMLHASLTKRLVCIAAPAGYGKTTALAQFVAQLDGLGIRSAWLSLDLEDNDPLRFMRYMAAALHRADPELGRGVLAQTQGGTMVSLDSIVASLLHDLTAHKERLLLVLDDFHLLHDENVHNRLEWLIGHLPSTVSIVVASRTRVPLSVSKLRLQDDLLELDGAHFGLDVDEAADLVQRVSGTVLEAPQLEALHRRTEGWVAGLQLASLALRESDDKSTFLADFSGSDRDITDYLGEQVLDSLSADLRDFLLDTAVLDRFCAPLCDEVRGRSDSHTMLGEVQSRNLFLSGLDRTRTWFRYHHLFADYLRGRNQQRNGDAARAICLRASHWFMRHHLPHEAVRYAFESGDIAHAADLVAEFSSELVQYRGEHGTLLNWFSRLPQTMVDVRPRIRTGHAWSLVLTRRYAEADAELNALEKMHVTEEGGDVRSEVEMIRCVYYALSDQALLARTTSAAWLNEWPRAAAFPTGVVANVLAAGCCVTDDFEKGIQALAIARRAFTECGAEYGLAWASALTTLIAMRQGDFPQALEHARHGLARVEQKLGVASYAGSMLTLLAADICYELGELEQAQRYLDLGRPFMDEHGLADMSLSGYLTRARLLRLRGDMVGADVCLLEGESLGHRLRLPRLVRLLSAERCVLRLSTGSFDEALRLAHSYGFVEYPGGHVVEPDVGVVREDSVELLVLRLRLARRVGSEALGLLADAVRRAQHNGHKAQLARLLVLRAAYQYRNPERAQEALRTLDEALQIAARCGLQRSLLDVDPAVPHMMKSFAGTRTSLHADSGQSIPPSYLHRLLSGAGRRVEVHDVSPASGERAPVDTLTERERKILRLLKAGLGNREIAQNLFLSEATIKWHLHNIFTKLGVRSRTSALAKAEGISLL
ncbi:LuxR C-terminal-related transcriptional regulator [Paraburkholderia flava]|uniref:LuxR C-terminal-related transcriptional regulator n=1 Tax=Paraburkholderia flava TaxID=2547393 RepID=UPI00105D3E23|nr:LuxR C-terminal-related transcriptional regulator [Paraburkholderia flava]